LEAEKREGEHQQQMASIQRQAEREAERKRRVMKFRAFGKNSSLAAEEGAEEEEVDSLMDAYKEKAMEGKQAEEEDEVTAAMNKYKTEAMAAAVTMESFP